mmetsp:Transcript_83320/g.258740  ORF Transcript_83320/g.258740 Transcript_83320/m.258740 type:complete len:340 (+) Transcript_83320:429-1448(+)
MTMCALGGQHLDAKCSMRNAIRPTPSQKLLRPATSQGLDRRPWSTSAWVGMYGGFEISRSKFWSSRCSNAAASPVCRSKVTARPWRPEEGAPNPGERLYFRAAGSTSQSVTLSSPDPGAQDAANFPTKPEPLPMSMARLKAAPSSAKSLRRPSHRSTVSMLGCMKTPPEGRAKTMPTPPYCRYRGTPGSTAKPRYAGDMAIGSRILRSGDRLGGCTSPRDTEPRFQTRISSAVSLKVMTGSDETLRCSAKRSKGSVAGPGRERERGRPSSSAPCLRARVPPARRLASGAWSPLGQGRGISWASPGLGEEPPLDGGPGVPRAASQSASRFEMALASSDLS